MSVQAARAPMCATVPAGGVALRGEPSPLVAVGARWARIARLAGGAVFLTLLVGLVLQVAHSGQHEAHELPPFLHWMRDSALALPIALAALVVAHRVTPRAAAWARLDSRHPLPAAVAAVAGALTMALGSVPGSLAHAALFGAHHEGMSPVRHAIYESKLVFVAAFAALMALGVLGGRLSPNGGRRSGRGPAPRRRRAALLGAVAAPGLALLGSGLFAPAGSAVSPAFQCGTTLAGSKTVRADVVALDQAFSYNRLGVDNPAGMIYALRRDVVSTDADPSLRPGHVRLRSAKRPRPLTLRVNVGDCLEIHFQNLLAPARVDKEQPADRNVGVHVNGLVLVDPDGAGPAKAIDSDGSYVGQNDSSLAAPGESRTYTLLGEHENTYLLSNPGGTTGAEAAGGTMAFGLFGAVNVEPAGTDWYRSQVTRDEIERASTGRTATGQPTIDYDATDASGTPILKILDDRTNEIVHSDLNAIVAGPSADGYRIPKKDYPQSYWDNQVYNMDSSRGQEPFREFTVIFHDEIFARQAFPAFFAKSAPTGHALHGVKDGFAVNYGTGGIGNEILANRLGVGPMWNCTDCKAEEFFLTSWVVGDPAMVVNLPANRTLAAGGPGATPGARATKALYPDDPSNVHHSYINDRVKFRNLHAGPKEHHIFHLHAHQWEFTPNTKKSGYLDSQMVGPGSGYTYEIAYGGSGNRNKTVGDAIFHCHFYPHFAQGMWEFWRVHDTFEEGTKLDANGVPAAGSRALPDGEITAGTPIPGIVPLPGRPMAPMPDADTTVKPYDLNGDGTADSSQVDANGDDTADLDQQRFDLDPKTNPGVKPLTASPGFPFFVPGVAGHRPPTAPTDVVDDGGLPRHIIVGGKATEFHTRLDFNKTLVKAKVRYLPEQGTAAERTAMDFHAALWHPTALPDGDPVDAAHPLLADPAQPAGRKLEGFETNGLPPQPGAPFAEPCRSDPTKANGFAVKQIGAARTYRGAVIQLDAKLNKLGWHFPQERILNLWGDVGATLSGKRAPEPLVMRLDVNDCATYYHTNLVPNVYDLDDWQVRTPTDVIGQHIHLVKFDVTSADGSGNGFNYEDGTFSPEEVRERIDAIREENGCAPSDGPAGPDDPAPRCPKPKAHPFFAGVAGVGDLALGARTTVQRWYADPVLNDSWDEGHGSVFTHDHFGPSTHQQVGLYSTVLVEPRGSTWRDPESGTMLGSRTAPVADGGPTSWHADILTADPKNAHREYYLEYSDFQQAYHAGGGALHTQDNGAGVQIPSYADFRNAVNPSFRQDPGPGHEADLFLHPDRCPPFAGAAAPPRPCAEAISADDIGTAVVNYRNEPIAARVFDPATRTQATGDRGDLALAFQSRTDRADPRLNTQPGFYPPLTGDVGPGDPYTPMLRAYAGDKVRIRGQVGATEEQHNMSVEGLKWLQEPLHPDSGWRNSQAAGISEYFSFDIPLLPDGPNLPKQVDYMYTMGAATDDLWNGIWGILRAYGNPQRDLQRLPNNAAPSTARKIANAASFDQPCPKSNNGKATNVVSYDVTALRAGDVLGPSGLTYNPRATKVDLQKTDDNGNVIGTARQGAGPLIDPTALMYVRTADIATDPATGNLRLRPGTPIEPLVLRAAAGDCIKVQLRNRLPAAVPDLPAYNALPPIVHKDENVDGGGIVSFNANDLRPSSLVGLHPQLVAYDQKQSEGFVTGANQPSLVAPGQTRTYTWYAGDLRTVEDAKGTLSMAAQPVEFGGANLLPADLIKGPSKGLAGALVIEPPGATWTPDPGTSTSAKVTFPDGQATSSFREFVTVLQDDVTFRYGGDCTPTDANLQCAVPSIHSEQDTPEDSEDSGQQAINYGAEPLWFRLGIAPNTAFDAPAMRENPDVHRVFSDKLPVQPGAPAGSPGAQAAGDPETPVFTASAGELVRMRMLEPGGHMRGHVIAVHGHNWQREPYVQGSTRESWTVHDDPTAFGDPNARGHNDVSQWVGSQEGFGPTSHFDYLIPGAGGRTGLGGGSTAGDYLFRDQGSFGNFNGLWGILRVK